MALGTLETRPVGLRRFPSMSKTTLTAAARKAHACARARTHTYRGAAGTPATAYDPRPPAGHGSRPAPPAPQTIMMRILLSSLVVAAVTGFSVNPNECNGVVYPPPEADGGPGLLCGFTYSTSP